MRFFAIDNDCWPALQDALLLQPKPWPEGLCRIDLRAQSRVGGGGLLSRRKLSERWGWGEQRVRTLLERVEKWLDECNVDEKVLQQHQNKQTATQQQPNGNPTVTQNGSVSVENYISKQPNGNPTVTKQQPKTESILYVRDSNSNINNYELPVVPQIESEPAVSVEAKPQKAKKSGKKQIADADVLAVYEHWRKLKPDYPQIPKEKSLQPIRRAIAEGYTVDELKILFDWVGKAPGAQWWRDPERSNVYNPTSLLRLETLQDKVLTASTWEKRSHLSLVDAVDIQAQPDNEKTQSFQMYIYESLLKLGTEAQKSYLKICGLTELPTQHAEAI